MSELAAGYWIGMLMGGMIAFVIAVVLVDWAWSKKVAQQCPDCGDGLFYYWTENLFLCKSCSYEKPPWFETKSDLRKG